MKRILTIPVLLLALITPSFAVPAWFIGFSVGVGINFVPWTKNHIVLPSAHAVQRTIRPNLQDKIDKQNRKDEKDRMKAERARHADPPQLPTIQ